MKRLVHDSEGVYMIDEECLRKREQQEREKEMRWQNVKSSKQRNLGNVFPQRQKQ